MYSKWSPYTFSGHGPSISRHCGYGSGSRGEKFVRGYQFNISFTIFILFYRTYHVCAFLLCHLLEIHRFMVVSSTSGLSARLLEQHG